MPTGQWYCCHFLFKLNAKVDDQLIWDLLQGHLNSFKRFISNAITVTNHFSWILSCWFLTQCSSMWNPSHVSKIVSGENACQQQLIAFKNLIKLGGDESETIFQQLVQYFFPSSWGFAFFSREELKFDTFEAKLYGVSSAQSVSVFSLLPSSL